MFVTKQYSDYVLIGTGTTVPITASEYKEIYVKLVNETWAYEFYLPVISLGDEKREYISGHYNSTTHFSLARIEASKTQIKDVGTYIQSKEVSSEMFVYGR